MAGKKVKRGVLKKLFKSQITANLFSLSSAEIVSRVLGFLTVVYLGRVLDKEGFGIIGFASAVVSYFVLVVNFGFNTYGAREISKDKNLTSNLVNNIFALRLLLALFLSLLLTVLIVLTDRSIQVKYIIFITGLNIFSNAIALNWVFQAVEKMQYIAIRQIVTGMLSLVGVILLVKSSEDLLIAAVVLTVSVFLGNLWLVPVYQKMFNKIRLEYSLTFWKNLIRESYPLAIASIMIGVYYNLDMVMLGYMKPESDVGVYNAAYKIFLLSIVPFGLIFSSFFPTLSRIGLNRSQEFSRTMKKYSKFILGVGIVSSLILLLFAKEIVLIVFGKKYLESYLPLSILAVNVFLISVNVYLGNPMTAWGKQTHYAVAITMGAVANVILNFLLIPAYSYTGAAIATVLSETTVFVGLFYLFRKFTKGLFV